MLFVFSGYKGDIDKPGASTLGGLIGPYGNSDDSLSEDEATHQNADSKHWRFFTHLGNEQK